LKQRGTQFVLETQLGLAAQRVVQSRKDDDDAVAGVDRLRGQRAEVGSLARLDVTDDKALDGELGVS
jgi:hypothetical protein